MANSQTGKLELERAVVEDIRKAESIESIEIWIWTRQIPRPSKIAWAPGKACGCRGWIFARGASLIKEHKPLVVCSSRSCSVILFKLALSLQFDSYHDQQGFEVWESRLVFLVLTVSRIAYSDSKFPKVHGPKVVGPRPLRRRGESTVLFLGLGGRVSGFWVGGGWG